MKKFMILDFGFEDPTPEILKVWGKWFEAIADKQVDHGGFSDGREISESGTDSEADTHQIDRAVVHPTQQRATSQNHAGCLQGSLEVYPLDSCSGRKVGSTEKTICRRRASEPRTR
jgi:hypothetical protein